MTGRVLKRLFFVFLLHLLAGSNAFDPPHRLIVSGGQIPHERCHRKKRLRLERRHFPSRGGRDTSVVPAFFRLPWGPPTPTESLEETPGSEGWARRMLLDSDLSEESFDMDGLNEAAEVLRTVGSEKKKALEKSMSEGARNKWDGVWQVAHAPHIRKLSKLLLCKLGPVEYSISQKGSQISSYCLYQSPFIGRGWLAAAGGLVREKPGGAGEETVTVVFDSFRWEPLKDRPTILRPGDGKKMKSLVDVVVQKLGELTFFENLSLFPVRFLDDRLCLFDFEAVSLPIVAKRAPSSLTETVSGSV
uniref:Plastid lipid-associated protein/fibrillin conserved domain-containing protein n=1 Tax=Chromera velia CCMP2878 TaxID=1169474 RepID=A0A0G4HTV7_9ALVE|eukprot:Cvel_1359.t1-p1 / transcript=Cvel_1359.t1 / gene=Cvel_1359 / organism=Chromera_velia_CCMP2878 / gene_product=hypothetical protein / transcript_product=hypothetical protein / location=Cvel_scaffold46:155626-156531(-) / protein_length=302 / sequence_SO=supercontig / SO=protein_coding / is_pseudo=false